MGWIHNSENTDEILETEGIFSDAIVSEVWIYIKKGRA